MKLSQSLCVAGWHHLALCHGSTAREGNSEGVVQI